MLITPGDRPERLARAVTLPADSVVFDLEDGVGAAQKPAARACVAEALRTLDFAGRERLVRTSAAATPDFKDDLAALPLDRLDAIFLPKAESPADVTKLAGWLDANEPHAARARPIDIVVSIETPRGLLQAPAIADASARTSALFFGSGDYAMATGGAVTERALAVPRALIVAAASAAGLQAIDAAYFTSVKDADATRADALVAKELGFCGKLLFHPNQITVCNEVFSPTEAEIARAQKIVAAWCAAQKAGHGTVVADGQFIAIDIVLMAERTLAIARQAGLLSS
ncbi:MAG: HpcH/HpaI aldolase/citrate lyase family protein [Hyphomicrobiaceae bacterium]